VEKADDANVLLNKCFAADGLPRGFKCAANFYKKLHICTLYLDKDTISFSWLIFVTQTHAHILFHHRNFHFMCNVLFSHAYILMVQVYIYVDTYLWPGTVSYPLLVRRNFVVCRHLCYKLRCAAGERRLRNTVLNFSCLTKLARSPVFRWVFLQNKLYFNNEIACLLWKSMNLYWMTQKWRFKAIFFSKFIRVTNCHTLASWHRKPSFPHTVKWDKMEPRIFWCTDQKLLQVCKTFPRR
jgi:hypothetical protein